MSISRPNQTDRHGRTAGVETFSRGRRYPLVGRPAPAGGADEGRRAASDGPARQARSAGRSAAPDVAAECLTQIRDPVHFAAGYRLRDALPRYGGREARGRSVTMKAELGHICHNRTRAAQRAAVIRSRGRPP
jgi:hypothetical protein